MSDPSNNLPCAILRAGPYRRSPRDSSSRDTNPDAWASGVARSLAWVCVQLKVLDRSWKNNENK